MIFVTCQRVWGAGGRIDTGSILLRLRENAALLQINYTFPVTQWSPNEPVAAFYGRADILSIDEARQFGYDIPTVHQQSISNLEIIAVLFDIAEALPEHTPVPTVQEVVTDAGIASVELEAPQRRRVRYRGKL